MQAANSAPSPFDTDIRRLRELLQAGQYAPALAAGQTLLSRAPENRDALYMVAIAERFLQRIPEALATLARLERVHSDYSRLYQERGHCFVALRSSGAAIDAFERAVKLSPALLPSWKALQALYRIAGRTEAAERAAAEIENLTRLPPEILTAFNLFADNEIYDAEQLLRRYLLTHGSHVEALRLLAQIGVRMDAANDAEVLLENAVKLAPGNAAVRYDYATVLLRRHKHLQARDETDKLLKKDPQNGSYRILLAAIASGLGRHESALRLFRHILEKGPEDAQVRLSLAHELKTVGRAEDAIESYRAAATARPRYGEAYWSLANLKTYRFTDAEIARMRQDEAAPDIALEDRCHFCFALGKALEDRGEYAESFGFYERGNALKKSESMYRPQALERAAELQATLCTPDFFAARQGAGAPDPAPLFIVGLPRSGSTLLEQILASHSQVEGTMELANIPRMVQDLPRYPAALAALEPEDFRRMGERYLADTRAYRSGKPGAPFFIDKMPNNFRHIGLIHLILPNARIIDARRDPIACCFSNFKQLFAAGQQFTYGFEDLARYYRMYVDLMAHWDLALPGKVLRMQYEDVVNDLEGNVRRMLEFCGLEFEPACTAFHETRRNVDSASSEQVRRPVNRDGIDQWRHYEPWLGPLKAALNA